jgi:hypothetical protein
MAKQAISVTLDADDLTWWKGRARAAGVRSVSELLARDPFDLPPITRDAQIRGSGTVKVIR